MSWTLLDRVKDAAQKMSVPVTLGGLHRIDWPDLQEYEIPYILSSRMRLTAVAFVTPAVADAIEVWNARKPEERLVEYEAELHEKRLYLADVVKKAWLHDAATILGVDL